MPEVMRVGDLSFHIYHWDEPPPHVHVERSGTWCIIAIGDADNPPRLITGGDMARTDFGRAGWIVNQCWEMLLAHWRRVHAKGTDGEGD